MNRNHSLESLANEKFDLLVIGGGATGLGCTVDAQLRGLRTALIEANDFASGTSSRSTKLAHGGIRYLEKAFKDLDFRQIGLVRDALRERDLLLKNAPFLSRRLQFLIPVYSAIQASYYLAGLKIYDFLGAGNDFPNSEFLSNEEVLGRMPQLVDSNLLGGILYWDGQFDDSRFAVALAQTAMNLGGVVANHVRLCGFDFEEGRISHAVIRDELSENEFRVEARVIVNATGPNSDDVRSLANRAASHLIVRSKGTHITVPKNVLPGATALLVPKTDDGRLIFAVPWEEHILIGTTETNLDQERDGSNVEMEEIEYLINHFNRYVRQKVTLKEVKSAFSGVRPLIRRSRKRFLGRSHQVHLDPQGLISILGGKWTTYRRMAEETIDQVCALAAFRVSPCGTQSHPLCGSTGWETEGWKELHQEYGLTADVSKHLHETYGSNADLVVAVCREKVGWFERLVPGHPILCGEVVYCTRNEMACTIGDILGIRLKLEFIDFRAAMNAAPVVGDLMARELKWDDTMLTGYVETYKKNLRSRIGILAHIEQG